MAFAGHGLKEVTIRIIPGRFDPLSVVGWEDAFFNERSPYRNAICAVDGENVDGHAADVRLAAEQRAVPLKMIRPAVLAGMEQRDVFSGKVTGRQRSLVGVAVFAAQGEVFRNGGAVQLFGNNMVNLEGKPSDLRRQLAILAPVVCSLPHETLEFAADRHGESPARLRESRAFDWTSSRSEATRSYSSSSDRSSSVSVS